MSDEIRQIEVPESLIETIRGFVDAHKEGKRDVQLAMFVMLPKFGPRTQYAAFHFATQEWRLLEVHEEKGRDE